MDDCQRQEINVLLRAGTVAVQASCLVESLKVLLETPQYSAVTAVPQLLALGNAAGAVMGIVPMLFEQGEVGERLRRELTGEDDEEEGLR